MTQEEKSLLLQGLCARLPYEVVYHRVDGANIKLNAIDVERGLLNYTDDIDERECKPYLRPMESMTEEEREELSNYLCERVMSNKIGITIPPNPTHGKGIPFRWMDDCINWLNKKGFNYRGLIPMGLALSATEGMYH